MRTPKGPKAGGRGAAGAKSQVNKLRKKAMKTKMMKKTMLALDDTKVRHASEITVGGCLRIRISNVKNTSIFKSEPEPGSEFGRRFRINGPK